jgi:hypothetical protein
MALITYEVHKMRVLPTRKDLSLRKYRFLPWFDSSTTFDIRTLVGAKYKKGGGNPPSFFIFDNLRGRTRSEACADLMGGKATHDVLRQHAEGSLRREIRDEFCVVGESCPGSFIKPSVTF